mmetsp:Transcript_19307/g.41689  ORF Transcript_19307/g.41689 Transcript_19307/m.41689 type:complete len:156 (+) Transcript_19307:486-953(+)
MMPRATDCTFRRACTLAPAQMSFEEASADWPDCAAETEDGECELTHDGDARLLLPNACPFIAAGEAGIPGPRLPKLCWKRALPPFWRGRGVDSAEFQYVLEGGVSGDGPGIPRERPSGVVGPRAEKLPLVVRLLLLPLQPFAFPHVWPSPPAECD